MFAECNACSKFKILHIYEKKIYLSVVQQQLKLPGVINNNALKFFKNIFFPPTFFFLVGQFYKIYFKVDKQ